MTTINSPHKKFDSAVNLIGESWLKNQLQTDQSDTSEEKYDYEVPTSHNDPPPVAKAYRMAREDLYDNQPQEIEFPEWRNESIDFLKLGKIYESIEKGIIIGPDGNRLEDPTIKDLFRDRLRSESEYKSSRYELEVAAAYIELGHTPAFIKEDESEEKTPDIELIDIDPSVQIECKHCRKSSENETKQSNRANQLFENIRAQLPQESHIVLLELSRTPTKIEVENIHDKIKSTKEIKNSHITEIDLPFGQLKIAELPFAEPILYPSYDMVGTELMTNFYDDIIRPAMSTYFDLDMNFDDYGNHVILFEAQDRKATKLIRRVNFIAIKESTWGKDVFNRFQNQFRNVSDKFGTKPSVLHIDFPSMNEGDSIQELKLRRHAGRQMVPRPDVSGVVVSGTIYHPKMSEDYITRRTIKVPNYNPNHEFPEEYKLIDPETAQSVDEMRKNEVNESLLKDPQGAEKAVAQQEGTLSFRFKPNEERPTKEKKFIVDVVSENNNKRLRLSITPNDTIQLEILDIETGSWTCDIDVSDFPDLDPLHCFITWSPEEVGLSIGHQSDDNLRHDRCTSPQGSVRKENEIPQRQ